jgi:hypothetical protein
MDNLLPPDRTTFTPLDEGPELADRCFAHTRVANGET